ncbi:hypothetical protein LCGC14_2686780 [marine sediment metagenome]|uniref:Uncharacterized protein n=1 Tax=marine sediment metagenome TaxID=412755 RepID=A0A0F9CBF3_9ZZZZ
MPNRITPGTRIQFVDPENPDHICNGTVIGQDDDGDRLSYEVEYWKGRHTEGYVKVNRIVHAEEIFEIF